MPRVTEQLVLGDRSFKAIRPQNNNTPAMFREANASSILTASVINLGVQEEKSSQLDRIRVKASIVQPVMGTEPVGQIDTNRVDIALRLNQATSSANLAILIADFRAFVASSEFELAMKGEAQY